MPQDEERPCAVHTEQIRQHHDRLEKLDKIMDIVRNRLPVWATIVLSILVGMIGFLFALVKEKL